MDEYEFVDLEVAKRTCAWCRGRLPKKNLHSVRARVRSIVNLDPLRGRAVEVALAPLAERSIIGVVPTEDSDAAKEGYGFIHALCSKKCVEELTEIMDPLIRLGDSIFAGIGKGGYEIN